MTDLIDPRQLAQRFERIYGRSAHLYRAPGRVNLIGEHTDYNDGFVLPVAIDRATWVAASPRTDRRISVRSEALDSSAIVNLDRIDPRPTGRWDDYVRGVVAALDRSVRLSGADLLVASDVPIGGGLSSSAALEVACGFALLDLAGASIDPTMLALACQRGEHESTGTRCGVMDQFVACHARVGHALLLDTRDLRHEWIALPAGVGILVCNTMVKHALASDEYNARRADCEEAVRVIARRMPTIRALRDVSTDLLQSAASELPSRLYRRCRHVIAENTRVQAFVLALRGRDFTSLGSLMRESHRSLRDDYEVSCAELDAMAEIAGGLPAVYGARMTGGGFGGCVVALVEEAAANRTAAEIRRRYEEQTGVRPEIWPCATGAAVSRW